MKRLLFSLFFLSVLTAEAAELSSDVLPENCSFPEDFSLSEPELRQAESFREFALFTLRRQKDPDQAFSHLLNALDRDPRSRELLMTAVQVCRREKGTVKTEKLVLLGKKHWDSPLLVFLSASLLTEKKEPEKALDFLQESMENFFSAGNFPENDSCPAQNTALLAGFLLNRGRTDEALKLLERAEKIPSIAEDPSYLQAAMAVCREMLKKEKQLRDPFPLNLFRASPGDRLRDRQRKTEKKFLDALASSRIKGEPGHFRAALLMFSADNEFEKAVLTAGYSLLRNPEDPVGFLALAELYQLRKDFRNEARMRLAAMRLSGKASLLQLYRYAHALFCAEDYRAAARELSRCIHLGLRVNGVMEEAVTAHLKNHDPDQALRLVRSMQPSFLRFQWECRILMEKKEYEAALQCALKLPGLLPADKQVSSALLRYTAFLIADAAEKAGHPEIMVRQFEAVLPLFPKDHELKNALGYTLADQNIQLPRAEKLIREAVACDPDNGAYLDSLAWVLYRKKQYPEALQWIRKSLKALRGPADPVILEHAGDILQANRQQNEARLFWRKALDAAGQDTKTRTRLARKIKE